MKSAVLRSLEAVGVLDAKTRLHKDISHDRSMGGTVYLPIHEWLMFMVNSSVNLPTLLVAMGKAQNEIVLLQFFGKPMELVCHI